MTDITSILKSYNASLSHDKVSNLWVYTLKDFIAATLAIADIVNVLANSHKYNNMHFTCDDNKVLVSFDKR